MQVELAGRRRRKSTAGRCKSPNAKSYMHTYRQDDKICTPSPRPSARQKDMRVTIVSERLLGPFIAILVVSSADAQLSLSLGQHNTDQADEMRGLIKVSAHISIYYYIPSSPSPRFLCLLGRSTIPNLT